MKTVGLFAGIGGLEAGLQSSGLETSLLCEIWGPAKTVLNARFPDTDLHDDVETLASLPADAEVLVAGFPCQDLSQAGRTAGISGKRSGLVGHVFRLLDRDRKKWVVLENVPFMLQLDSGSAMRTLVEEFEVRGYRWAYRIVNSLSFLPQRRERVIFVATNTDTDPADILLSDDAAPDLGVEPLSAAAHGFYWTEGIRGLGWAENAIPTLKNGSTVGIASPPAILLPNGAVVTPEIRDAERLQGFDVDWTLPAEGAGKASLRWSLVGNAVTVPVAKWLGASLLRPGQYETDRDRSFEELRRWPRAARSDGKKRHCVDIGSYPVWQEREPLHAFLQFPGKPLSARATRGFLSRAARAKLRFAPGFLDLLRTHLSHMETKSDTNAPAFAVAAE
ncbi:DNA (cytosine-5-)-methyltransferase [Rhizobium sp. S-51]|uniref:Cytosine-specific methyltransferase n=1 Tax=Rhizobium terricola TaxID=2728849 RepID=A0A7Y0AT91_9HYPH|nr:DNA (cytosine-5-)-methyltransferase [Rhizobium terricola]NML73053.1 DNA (cytosine-5-)-methyltransferase [Rhizobium terricola]